MLDEYIMDFRNIKNECPISNSFNATFMSENRFCQDTRHRHRKSPRKKLRVTTTSALVIDQLKSDFQHADDFAPRMRARRNWRPEFLIRYLGDNRRGDNEKWASVQRSKSRFVPETPMIYSIGLRTRAESVGDFDDYLCSALRNFKRRFRRLLITACKHWVAQPTASLSTAISLKERADQQTGIIDCPKLADISKLDQSQKIGHHDDQSYVCIEGKDGGDVPSTSQSNLTDDDRSFTPDPHYYTMVRYCKHGWSRRILRDAQVQTSNRKDAQVQTSSKRSKISRQKKTMKKSLSTNGGCLYREHDGDEPKFRLSIADFRPDVLSSDRANRNEERLSIRFPEKRAEYINKFTSVKRQIEEITTTLRETCYSEKNSRDNPENCEIYFSSAHGDANAILKEDINSDEVDDEEDNDIIEDETIGSLVNDHKNVERILDVSNVNDDIPVFSGEKYAKNTTVSTTSLHGSSSTDDVFAHDCIRTLTIKETLCPSDETTRTSHKKRAKHRLVRQFSSDLDSTQDNDEARGFSVENRSFGEVNLRNIFETANDDENVEVSIKDFANLERSDYYKMTVDEKVGEIAVLNDIKKRIDRDFDDPTAMSEKDTEDFLTVSQKNINLENDSQFYRSASTEDDTTSTTIVESPPCLDSAEVQIRDLVWADTTSELSNRNSMFSMYHSCMQFPSFVSLRENEDEDQSAIANDSYLNSHSNIDCYDLNVHSNVDYFRASNYHSSSNLNFDQSHDEIQRIAQHDTSTKKYPSLNRFPSEMVNESNDACDMFENRKVADKAYDREYLLCKSNEEERESHVHLEQQYAADSTFETSKSSRCIGSIDSGVFVNSSLNDLQPQYSSFDGGKSEHKRKQRRVKERELHGSSRTFDFSSDDGSSSSCCTDDTLDRRINDVIRDLTKNLVLCERRVRMKLREMRKTGLRARDVRCYLRHSPPRACKFNNSFDAYDFFKSPQRFSEDERISGISTPSFMSLPESEIEDCESFY